MAPKVTSEHQEQRREQIIAAAIACFAEKGFHKTSMKDICTRADLSPGAVYNYFKSKDEIIETVCKSGEENNRVIFDASAANGDSMRDQVMYALGGYRRMLDNPFIEQWIRADLMFYAESLTNPKLMKFARENTDSLLQALKERIQNWMDEGVINSELDPMAVARVLVAMVNGIGLQSIYFPDLNKDNYFKVIASMILGEFHTGK